MPPPPPSPAVRDRRSTVGGGANTVADREEGTLWQTAEVCTPWATREGQGRVSGRL